MPQMMTFLRPRPSTACQILFFGIHRVAPPQLYIAKYGCNSAHKFDIDLLFRLLYQLVEQFEYLYYYQRIRKRRGSQSN